MTAAPEARTPSPNPPHKPATGTTHPPKPPPAATTTKTDEKRPSHDEVVSLSDEESSTEKTSSVDKWKRGQEARAQEACVSPSLDSLCRTLADLHESNRAKLKAEDKAFYEELTREDQQEEAEFMKLIKQDADDIRQARRIIRDARHLANRKAEPIHRSSCPESADVEPPLEYHQQAWEKEQRAKMPPASSKLAPARNGYQGPPVPSLQTSSSSASDDGDEDPYEESIRSSGVDSEGSITADEDDIRPPPDTLMHNGSHVRFKPKARAYPPKNNNGPAPPPTYDATAAGQQSSYDMNGPNPMDSPYDAPTPGSMSPTPNGSMGPPPEMTPYASKPALKSKRGPPPTGRKFRFQ